MEKALQELEIKELELLESKNTGLVPLKGCAQTSWSKIVLIDRLAVKL